jgi:hypothetical protein
MIALDIDKILTLPLKTINRSCILKYIFLLLLLSVVAISILLLPKKAILLSKENYQITTIICV